MREVEEDGTEKEQKGWGKRHSKASESGYKKNDTNKLTCKITLGPQA